jgi:hypothetical protein
MNNFTINAKIKDVKIIDNNLHLLYGEDEDQEIVFENYKSFLDDSISNLDINVKNKKIQIILKNFEIIENIGKLVNVTIIDSIDLADDIGILTQIPIGNVDCLLPNGEWIQVVSNEKTIRVPSGGNQKIDAVYLTSIIADEYLVLNRGQ